MRCVTASSTACGSWATNRRVHDPHHCRAARHGPVRQPMGGEQEPGSASGSASPSSSTRGAESDLQCWRVRLGWRRPAPSSGSTRPEELTVLFFTQLLRRAPIRSAASEGSSSTRRSSTGSPCARPHVSASLGPRERPAAGERRLYEQVLGSGSLDDFVGVSSEFTGWGGILACQQGWADQAQGRPIPLRRQK